MPYHLQGEIDGHDVEGDGTCLATTLIAYAADCRKDAASYQRISEELLAEAARAEAAATAAAYADEAKGAG